MATILVVDDEPAITEVLQAILEDEGYQVVTAGNGQAGLARMAEVRPALVVSDVMMPGLDGRALCRAIQANPCYRAIPVVLISAVAAPPEREGCRYAAFVHKPFDVDTLIGTISRVLDEPPGG